MFKNRKQIVKIKGKYAARFRKWYQPSWTYTGVVECHISFNERFCLYGTEEEAMSKLSMFTEEVEVVREYE